MKLQDKVAIIAGGTKGIGLGIALEFVQEGAKVVVGGTNPKNGESAESEIAAAGGDGMFVKCDVSSLQDLDNIVTATTERYGRLDIYAANAGINDSEKTHFLDISPEQYDQIMAVNLRGMFFGGQKAAQPNGSAGRWRRHHQHVVSKRTPGPGLADGLHRIERWNPAANKGSGSRTRPAQHQS